MKREVGRRRRAEQRGPGGCVDLVEALVGNVNSREDAGFNELGECFADVALRESG